MFKTGDIVKCIDGTREPPFHLITGRKYVVEDVFPGKILVRNELGSIKRYTASRFATASNVFAEEYEHIMREQEIMDGLEGR